MARIHSVIECKNPRCRHKMAQEGYPKEWPEPQTSDDRIHSEWNDNFVPFCAYCPKCGHYTGNKIHEGGAERDGRA